MQPHPNSRKIDETRTVRLDHFDFFVDHFFFFFVDAFERERIRQHRFALFHAGDHVRTSIPVRFSKVGLRPASRVVGMRVVEADNVLSTLAAFALDFNELFGVDVVAVVGRVGARIAGTGDGGDESRVVVDLADKDSAAFVGVGFFSVLAEGVVELAADL